MPETKAETVQRLRREAKAAELQGQHVLDASGRLNDQKLRDMAVMAANSLFAEAKALRQQADWIEADARP
jgi:hypothetical protein